MTDRDMPAQVDWDDYSELHRKDDGGGVLSGFKQVRHGTLAEMVRFVSHLPEDEQRQYAIERRGGNRLDAGAIVALSRRADFPAG